MRPAAYQEIAVTARAASPNEQAALDDEVQRLLRAMAMQCVARREATNTKEER